jgi:hypothetical protein
VIGGRAAALAGAKKLALEGLVQLPNHVYAVGVPDVRAWRSQSWT